MSKPKGRPKKEMFLTQRIYTYRIPYPVYIEFRNICKKRGQTVNQAIREYIIKTVIEELE